MKRTGNTGWLMAILAAGMLMLSACSEGDGRDFADVRSSISTQNAESMRESFNGEWTVNQQVVDTARLEVTEVLRVRLPEAYLVGLCFNSGTDKASLDSDTDKASEDSGIEPLGIAAKIEIRNQGYTNEASFSDFTTSTEKYDGVTLYRTAYFVVIVNGDKYLVELLSPENGNAVFRTDTMGWTIAIPIDRFRVTNVQTMKVSEQRIVQSTTLYYNTKERIR